MKLELMNRAYDFKCSIGFNDGKYYSFVNENERIKLIANVSE